MRQPLTDPGPAPSTPGLELLAACDGASQGNPGPAGIGVVIADAAGRVLQEISEPIGRTTNNQAEYTALIRALEAAAALGAVRLRVQMDSELVVFQMQGIYRVRNARLLPLYQRATELARRFERVQFAAVRREMNQRADALASAAASAARHSLARGLQRPPRLPFA